MFHFIVPIVVISIIIIILFVFGIFNNKKPVNFLEMFTNKQNVWLQDAISLIKKHKPTYLTSEEHSFIDSKNYHAYNPGCFVHNNDIYIVVRICNLTWCSGTFTLQNNFSSTLIVFSVKSGKFLVVDIAPSTNFYTQHGIEDPKCIIQNGKLYMFCTHHNERDMPRICVLYTNVQSLVNDVEEGENAHYFQASSIGVSNIALMPIEKNWMPVEIGNDLYLIYRLEPFTLLYVNRSTWTCTKISEKRSGKFGWDIIRGTSNVIDYDDYKLCIGHYRNDNSDYFHTFIKITPQKNMQIIEKSSMFKFDRKNKVEFANGLTADLDGNIIVTYGVQDCTANIIRISPKMINNLFETEDRLIYLM